MSRFLFEAAGLSDVEKVRAYLDKGADIEWTHKGTGRTSLIEAAINGQLEVARLLVERGADINARDTAMGYTPLGWACEGNHESLVAYLLEAGANPNIATLEYLLTPLMAAARNNNLSIAKRLLSAGADINAEKCDAQTALEVAQSRKHVDFAQALRELGATAGVSRPKPVPIPWPEIDESLATCDYSRPESVLRSFILAMNRYEREAAALHRASSIGAAKDTILASMQTVFDAYCTPIKRPYVRFGSFQVPPEYDPAERLIEINQLKPSRTELVTLAKDEKHEFLYVALKKKDRWLLDSKKMRLIGANWFKACI